MDLGHEKMDRVSKQLARGGNSNRVNSEFIGNLFNDEELFRGGEGEREWETNSDAGSGSRRFSFLRPATLPYQITVNAIDTEDYLSVRDQTVTILERLQAM